MKKPGCVAQSIVDHSPESLKYTLIRSMLSSLVRACASA